MSGCFEVIVLYLYPQIRAGDVRGRGVPGAGQQSAQMAAEARDTTTTTTKSPDDSISTSLSLSLVYIIIYYQPL